MASNSQNTFYTAEEPNRGSQNLSGMEPSMPPNRVNEIVDDNRKFTSNIVFIHAMYQVMKDAAVKACRGKHFFHNPDDITILGGATYNIYADMLKIPLMPTSDIDMTWWPRTDTVIPPKELTALSSLVLQSIPKEPSLEWNAVVGSLLGMEVSKIEFELEDKPFPPNRRDVIMNRTIELTIRINGTHYFKNICSLAIRNALNSQEFTMNHRVVGKNEMGMTYDPTYCNPLNTAIVGSSRVPQLGVFISQQLFSFKNLFLTGKIEKANIQLQRVIHIYIKVKTDDIASQFLSTYRTILTQRRSAQDSVEDAIKKIVEPSGLWNHIQFIMYQMMQQSMIQQQMMQQPMMQQPMMQQPKQSRKARQAHPPHQQLPQMMQQPKQSIQVKPFSQPPSMVPDVAPVEPNRSNQKPTIQQLIEEIKGIMTNKDNKELFRKFKIAMKAIKDDQHGKIFANHFDNINNSLGYGESEFVKRIPSYIEKSNDIEADPIVNEPVKKLNRELLAIFTSIQQQNPLKGGSRKKRTIKRKKNKSKTHKRSTR